MRHLSDSRGGHSFGRGGRAPVPGAGVGAALGLALKRTGRYGLADLFGLAGLGGLVGLVGLAGLGGLVVVGRGGPAALAEGRADARSVAQAEVMKEPLSPQPSSLAPVETEAFRERYGQEALFRLKLGVEAGERSAAPLPGPAVACEAGWPSSPQGRAFQAALARQQWYGAGEALGAWRRQCGGAAGRGMAP
jgi:hypothetical protein